MAVERYAVTDTSSTRPYLIRAIHEWCADNGLTPYVAVQVDDVVQVPREYVKNGEIVLNISYDATNGLALGNEFIEFKARFGGVPRDILIPVGRVIAIYARENGQGMAFPAPVSQSDVPARAGPTLMSVASPSKADEASDVAPTLGAAASDLGGGAGAAESSLNETGAAPGPSGRLLKSASDSAGPVSDAGALSSADTTAPRGVKHRSGSGRPISLAAVGARKTANRSQSDSQLHGASAAPGGDAQTPSSPGESGGVDPQPPRPNGGGKPPLKRVK